MEPKTCTVLVLNASLKHEPDVSNTEEVTDMVIQRMKSHGDISVTSIRLADKDIPVGKRRWGVVIR